MLSGWISMESEKQKSRKKSKTGLPEELVTYLDFAVRLRRSYETKKMQNNPNRKNKKSSNKTHRKS